ncbi:MAG: phenylalanine--tRNA ligase subunit beta [Saprospiraceae bacterium]
MKVSLNWLKDYLDIPLSTTEVSLLLTDIGLEVEGEAEIEDVKGGLQGIVIGKVVTCDKHPNADKLSLTTVDVGAEALLQIVCGAPNVAADQKVLVATVGTTLYTPEGEAWKIKKGKIRGEVSEGMICAEDELGLGESHDGIMVLPDSVEVGSLASDYFKIETDVVFEIGLTPNRSDATAQIGVAKDLAAALKVLHQQDANVKMPDVADFVIDNQDLPISVVVEDAKACPRYSGLSISGITVKESPAWIKKRLNSIGVRPINNIVDITNFVLHELGQPLHAFDADKIAGKKIIVKTLAEGTSFTTLDEQERKLSAEDLMICDGEGKGMCIAGVFGGIASGVTEATKNIFLESAHFEAIQLRRSSTRHLLFTDASKIFEKGSDPNVTLYALKRAALLIKELAGGSISSEIVDVYPQKIEPQQIAVSYHKVTRLIGVEIPHEKIKEILVALEMKIISETETGLTVAVPTNKSDVLREVDIIEEVLRIYGFNQVPIPTQIKSTIIPSVKPDPRQIQNLISDYLVANGFAEMMALSLSQGKYYEDNILAIEEKELVYVNNTSNIHLNVMRPSVLVGGLEAIVHNQNRQNPDLKLFEYGKSYRKLEKGFSERKHLAMFMTGQRYTESWLNEDKAQVSFYTLKRFVQNVLEKLGIKMYQESALSDQVFSFGVSYHRGPQSLVQLGKLQNRILKKMDIKQPVFYANFDWDNILKALKKHKIDFVPITKYPSIRRDLAIVIDNSIYFSDIAAIARKEGKKLLKEINLFDVYENETQLGKGKKSYAVSFIFEDVEKTLKDKEIDKIMNKLIANYETKLKATIRR